MFPPRISERFIQRGRRQDTPGRSGSNAKSGRRENRWLIGEGMRFGVAEIRLCSRRGKRYS